ncbi:23S rRNA (uracil(1939)-C(5))-methyltransferase RlmD [Desulfovibrio mangrovi]|uniref:23S rRNA (uracil(1939)-C(5))-methyltransferase RlmD n=1 Tax=Desulfovibrio mangrovi TaxID=2976983 RepID=UPI002246834D|nr:23S rRNA (uracil(1939)-C(5))-methyltransferase RlmD [Desulfovibrio mangrovi]UZP69040.1 23S rRNA (uracil(1939)-C(5))-methyltransferase RlmD [Desulfovibrio mangrovi]
MPATALTAGTTLELFIDSLATGGQAIARREGMVIFVDRGLPGQTVLATITRTKKRFAEATLERVITRNNTEIQPFCKHFGICGGCHWQHLPYEEQLEWKRRFAEDSMRRIAGADGASALPTIPSPDQRMYRNKMEFAFLQGRDTIHLGLRRSASHSIINITECHLQSEHSVAIVQTVRQWANRHKLLNAYDARSGKGYLRFLVVRETKYSNQCMVQLITTPDWSPTGQREELVRELAAELREHSDIPTSAVHSVRSSKTQVAYGEDTIFIEGAPTLSETISIDKHNLTINIGGADSFFQTNTKAAEALYGKALQLAALTGKETVWDLYCGIGALSLASAMNASRVVGFEISEAAVSTARQNAEQLSLPNTSFHAGDVRLTMALESVLPDVLITDPPRGGMHPDVVAAIDQHGPERIVYISCDPATQARDIGLLIDKYAVCEIQPVDMFPHTPHVENIVLLKKRS